MPQIDDGSGDLYEQVLEYAKREMDEAAHKMGDIKQSLQLLEARVEAAKAVYQAVASRLNLEDESGGVVYETSFPDVPAQAPEPPPVSASAPPHQTAAPVSEASLAARSAPTSKVEVSVEESVSEIDAPDVSAFVALSSSEPTGPAPVPGSAVVSAGAASDGDESFNVQLIRQHLEQKAKQQDEASAPLSAPEASDSAPGAAKLALPPEEASTGLSEADRELIGAYLRSKQN